MCFIWPTVPLPPPSVGGGRKSGEDKGGDVELEVEEEREQAVVHYLKPPKLQIRRHSLILQSGTSLLV